MLAYRINCSKLISLDHQLYILAYRKIDQEKEKEENFRKEYNIRSLQSQRPTFPVPKSNRLTM